MAISELVAALFIALGSFFTLSAVLGLLRFPDAFTRMHAVTKAGTVGVAFFMLATATVFGEPSVITRAVGVVLFVLLTAPVGAQMIGRAAYLSKAPVARSTVVDEIAEAYSESESEPPQADTDEGAAP